VGVLAYSLPALATVFASSFQEVTLWRFLAGIGIGGVVPNVIALLTEAAPKRHRVTFVMASFVGYSAGNASIAQVAAWFIPVYGWQIVFLVAGVTGVVFCAVLALLLPESVPYLAATKPDSPKLRLLVQRALPELALKPEDRIVLHRPVSERRFSLRLLFESYRRIATPLLWIAFFAESLTFMTFSSWLVLLLEAAGLSSKQATQTFSYASFGAMIAVFTLGRLIDYFGPKATVVSASIAIAAIVYLGMPGLSPAALVAVAILAQASASATHQALNGIVGAYYPTIIRGNGVGIATGMGRVAAIIGPGVVGILMAAKVPLQEVLICIAAPDLVVAAACVGLHLLRKSPAARADFERPGQAVKEQMA
jgi:AAHS family 4-hydroxybenzoate transporter-like MFS transporter